MHVGRPSIANCAGASSAAASRAEMGERGSVEGAAAAAAADHTAAAADDDDAAAAAAAKGVH